MLSSIKLFMALSVLGACLQGSALYGQENKAPMYLEAQGKGESEQRVEPIYTGLVVAYGVRIPPPYYVTLRNDSVFINDVLLSPRKSQPRADTISAVTPEWLRGESDLFDETVHRFYSLYKRHGFEQAKQIMLREYREHDLLDSLQVVEPYNLKLYYRSGHYLGTSIGLMLLPPMPRVNRDSLANEKLVSLVEGTRLDLRRNCIFLYSYEGGEYALWNENAAEFRKIMHDVRHSTISLEEARLKLDPMFINKKLITEILEHLDSWD